MKNYVGNIFKEINKRVPILLIDGNYPPHVPKILLDNIIKNITKQKK